MAHSDHYASPQNSRVLTSLAWGITLLVSTLPDIAWIEFNGQAPNWLTLGKMGLLLTLSLAACFCRTLRPLRKYVIVMLAFFGLFELRPHVDFTWPALQAICGNSVFDVRMQAEQTSKLAIAFAMVIGLVLLGYKRRDFFLARGHLRAPIKPVPLLGFPKADPWSWFGLQWGFYIAAALAVLLYLGLRPNAALLLKAAPMLPSILLYAALNAFNEEMTYRAPMLATLEAGCGSKQALWQSAYFFGIAHYFGTPGGILGAIASVFMGWILSKAMLETRGLFWSWWIHFLSDVVIFSFLAMSLVK